MDIQIPSRPSFLFHYYTWHLQCFVINEIVIKMCGVRCIYNKDGGGDCAHQCFMFFWQGSLKWLLDYPIYKLSGKTFCLMKKEKIKFNRAHNSTSKDPHKCAISSEEIRWGQWQALLPFLQPLFKLNHYQLSHRMTDCMEIKLKLKHVNKIKLYILWDKNILIIS